jgi:hypothetical protein
MDPVETTVPERLRDLISVCEFRTNEFTPESAVRFLKDTGFFDQYIIIGVKHGKGWRRSRCITTFEGRPADAGAILGHLADYFGREQENAAGESHAADGDADGDEFRSGDGAQPKGWGNGSSGAPHSRRGLEGGGDDEAEGYLGF